MADITNESVAEEDDEDFGMPLKVASVRYEELRENASVLSGLSSSDESSVNTLNNKNSQSTNSNEEK